MTVKWNRGWRSRAKSKKVRFVKVTCWRKVSPVGVVPLSCCYLSPIDGCTSVIWVVGPQSCGWWYFSLRVDIYQSCARRCFSPVYGRTLFPRVIVCFVSVSLCALVCEALLLFVVWECSSSSAFRQELAVVDTEEIQEWLYKYYPFLWTIVKCLIYESANCLLRKQFQMVEPLWRW